VPPPDPQRWQEQYKHVAREARRVLKAHRDIARWSLGRIPMGPSTLRARGRVLDEHPLGAAGRPDPDPVALLQSQRHQAARDAVDPLVELA
jgi:hypothetical protein